MSDDLHPTMIAKAVNSALFTLIARGLMILAATVGLPIAGVMMSRVLDRADKVIEKVETQGGKIDLMEQRVQFQLQAIESAVGSVRFQLNDHEGRIRVIENRTPLPPIPR